MLFLLIPLLSPTIDAAENSVHCLRASFTRYFANASLAKANVNMPEPTLNKSKLLSVYSNSSDIDILDRDGVLLCYAILSA